MDMAAISFLLAIIQDRDDEGEAPVKTCKFQTDPPPIPHTAGLSQDERQPELRDHPNHLTGTIQLQSTGEISFQCRLTQRLGDDSEGEGRAGNDRRRPY